jgi:hypothetical protein
VGVRSSGEPAFSKFPLPRAIRSSTTLAGVAEDRYTQEMPPGLGPIQDAEAPGVGRGCPISGSRYAERYAREIPETVLVRIKSARRIPVKNAPRAAAGALAEFFVAER